MPDQSQVVVVGRDEARRRGLVELLVAAAPPSVRVREEADLDEVTPVESDSGPRTFVLLIGDPTSEPRPDMARRLRNLRSTPVVIVLPPAESDLAPSLAALGPHEVVEEEMLTGERLLSAIDTARERHARETLLLDDAQRLRSALQSRSQFIGMVAHELKNSLNSITMFSELIWESPVVPEGSDERSWLGLLRQSASDTIGVLQDLLDLAKVEAGQLTLRWSRVSIHRLLEQVTESYRVAASKKGLALEVVIADDCPDSIHTDSPRLRQVLSNLISNALKFTDSGRVDVRVAVSDESSPGQGGIEFTVSDTGRGISATAVERIFDPFWQNPDDVGDSRDGSGLGLFISRRIVEFLGGAFDVRSEPGRGSDFTIRLPGRPSLRSVDRGHAGLRLVQR